MSSNLQTKPNEYSIKAGKGSTNWISSLHKTFASEKQIWKFANNFYRKVSVLFFPGNWKK